MNRISPPAFDETDALSDMSIMGGCNMSLVQFLLDVSWKQGRSWGSGTAANGVRAKGAAK
jgi:hypothetical protein